MTVEEIRSKGMVVTVQDSYAHVRWSDADNTVPHDCFVALEGDELVFHPERSSAQKRLLAKL